MNTKFAFNTFNHRQDQAGKRMDITQAIADLQAALASARPGCFVQVSPAALSVVLAAIEAQQGEVDGAD